MLLPYKEPEDKTLIQMGCRFAIKNLENKPTKPTDKLVCYQLTTNPYEKAYIFNKKYEELFKKLACLYQKSGKFQKYLIEHKIYPKLVNAILITSLSISAAADSNTINTPYIQIEKEINAEVEEENSTLNEDAITKATNIFSTITEEELEKVQNEIYWAQNFKSIMVEEIESKAIYDSYIQEYCEYYNLDAEKVIKLAKNLTNGYNISFQNFIPAKFESWTPEAACMRFVYYLNRNKLINDENIEYSLADFKLEEDIITIPHNNIETIVLNNGESLSQNLGKICDYFEYDEKCLALSFAYVEAGQKGSYSSRNKNNPYGIMDGEETKTFPTLEAANIDHVGNLKEHYPLSKYHINDLETLAAKYNKAPNPETRAQWQTNMKKAYDKINAKYEEFFPSLSQEENEILYLGLTK